MNRNGEGIPVYDATPGDVARHFKVAERTVRRWCETTDIPHRRIQRAIRFNLAEVDAWASRGGRPTKATKEAV